MDLFTSVAHTLIYMCNLIHFDSRLAFDNIINIFEIVVGLKNLYTNKTSIIKKLLIHLAV